MSTHADSPFAVTEWWRPGGYPLLLRSNFKSSPVASSSTSVSGLLLHEPTSCRRLRAATGSCEQIFEDFDHDAWWGSMPFLRAASAWQHLGWEIKTAGGRKAIVLRTTSFLEWGQRWSVWV